jgi:hypothetical protein
MSFTLPSAADAACVVGLQWLRTRTGRAKTASWQRPVQRLRVEHAFPTRDHP